MTVKLIWATPDADDLVAYMARVSNPDAALGDPGVKLIAYLIRHKHWSPFEMANVCLQIDGARDVTRQLLRHWSINELEADVQPGRSAGFQEFSQRYASVDALPEAPLREARMQHPTNRQASVVCEDRSLRAVWRGLQEKVRADAVTTYEWALSHGIAKEVARAVLPEGLTMSRLYMNGSLRSWLHFCDLRRGNGTQPETQAVAEACWSVLRETCPMIVKAWESVQ
jgi:thymidylate synthase (FAD)